MKQATCTVAEVPTILADTQGGFFTVVFTKRTTGETRTMRATLNYKGALKGGQAAYDHKAKGLLVVRDMDATRDGAEEVIKSIPMDAVSRIVANGVEYAVTP